MINFTKLYIWSRQIHKLLIFVMTFLTLLMTFTGLLLKYSNIVNTLPFINLTLMRYLHNNLSPFFAVVLILMLITGLYMYVYPTLKKSSLKTKTN